MGTGHERLFLRGRVWWCWGYDSGGQRWQETTRQRDHTAAKLAAREITRRNAGVADIRQARAQAGLTLERGLADLREALQRKGRTPATLRAVRYHCAHLQMHLGAATPLADVDLAQTTRYVAARLDEGGSRHTVAKELYTLTAALRRAAKLGLLVLRTDPRHLIPEDLGKVYTPRDRWLTREEYARLRAELATSAGHHSSTEDRRDYLDAWVYLGLRKTELYSVRAQHCDQTRWELEVQGTKTEGAERKVPVAAPVRPMLKRRLQQEVPFPDWHTVTRDLARACARAGLEAVTPNDLRRTFCSWLCQAGVPERVCADLLGHEDTTMVRAVYGHLDARTLAGAVALLPAVAGSLQQNGRKRVKAGHASSRNAQKSR